MIKFLKKYRNLSLVVGALVIATISGISGAFQLPKNASDSFKIAAKQFSRQYFFPTPMKNRKESTFARQAYGEDDVAGCPLAGVAHPELRADGCVYD